MLIPTRETAMDLDDRFDEIEADLLDLEMAEPPAYVPPSDWGGGRRPARDTDHWLSRSPWWLIPIGVSLIIGLERVLMLATVPGWRDLSVVIFGSLFLVTFTVVLAAGGLIIHRHRH